MDMRSKKTALTSPIPPIDASSSSLMMSPPSEPDSMPKQTAKTFQLVPGTEQPQEPAENQAEPKPEPEPEVKVEEVESEKPKNKAQEPEEATMERDASDDDYDDYHGGALVIDVPNEPSVDEEQEVELGMSYTLDDGQTTTDERGSGWPGCEMLNLLAAAAAIRSNSERTSSTSSNGISPQSSMTSWSTSSSPSSGHSTVSAVSAATAIAVKKPKVSGKRSLEYPSER